MTPSQQDLPTEIADYVLHLETEVALARYQAAAAREQSAPALRAAHTGQQQLTAALNDLGNALAHVDDLTAQAALNATAYDEQAKELKRFSEKLGRVKGMKAELYEARIEQLDEQVKIAHSFIEYVRAVLQFDSLTPPDKKLTELRAEYTRFVDKMGQAQP